VWAAESILYQQEGKTPPRATKKDSHAICGTTVTSPSISPAHLVGVLRSAIGKGDADMDIENYYSKNHLVAPWIVGPQRVLQRSVTLVEEPTKDFANVPKKKLSSGNKISSESEASFNKSEIGLDILEQFSSAEKEALLKVLITSLMTKGA
jgi:hypothetical protein